jgi:hypothetical protein
VPWKDFAGGGETPGLVRVQVGQREPQHAQLIPRLAVLPEGQDAIWEGREEEPDFRVGRQTLSAKIAQVDTAGSSPATRDTEHSQAMRWVSENATVATGGNKQPSPLIL